MAGLGAWLGAWRGWGGGGPGGGVAWGGRGLGEAWPGGLTGMQLEQQLDGEVVEMAAVLDHLDEG